MTQILSVNCLKHVYPDKTEISLCGLGLSVTQGERLCILGPNGSGKTTLLSHVVGLLRPVEGEVRLFGVDPAKHFREIRKRVGVVFQNVDDQLIGPTVWDDVCFSLRSNGRDPESIARRTEEVLSLAGIPHIRQKLVHYLSGGEKKRVAMAGAIANNPELLILDEPFDGLDPRSKIEIIELLLRWNADFGTTLIITTHDMDVVPVIANRVCILRQGQILKTGSPADVLADVEALRAANLEPPSMYEFFQQLARAGYKVRPPLGVQDALTQIVELLARSG